MRYEEQQGKAEAAHTQCGKMKSKQKRPDWAQKQKSESNV
jgi:hypothetical protein